jgi:hypothetical protein
MDGHDRHSAWAINTLFSLATDRMRARRRRRWLRIGIVAVGVIVIVAVWRIGTDDSGDHARSSASDRTTTTSPVSPSTAPSAASTPTTPVAPEASPESTPVSTAAAPPDGTEAALPASGLAGDGTFTVGGPYVPAGIYVSKGAAKCSWQRASDNSGDPASVIAKDEPSGEARVQLAAGEVFTTSGCSRWVFVSAA